MCRLIESIRVENGIPLNLEYHQRRVDRSRKILFGAADRLDLSQIFPSIPPSGGTVKWRVVYGLTVVESTFGPYVAGKIRSLQMVRNNEARYPFKYHDRAAISDMYRRKGKCDDILVIRNGLVTDTSYANIVFFDGSSWITPRNPLLCGTCRERLLETGRIREEEITEQDVWKFVSASLVNAMLELGEVVVRTRDIIPVPSSQ